MAKVSQSGFSAWRGRGPSRRAIDDAVMTKRIPDHPCAGRVVGWSIGERMTGDLVLAALNRPLEQRKPDEKRAMSIQWFKDV